MANPVVHFEILGRDAAALRRLNPPTARSVVMHLATYGTIVHKNRRSPWVTGRNACNHESLAPAP
jgi:hypothetical protein